MSAARASSGFRVSGLTLSIRSRFLFFLCIAATALFGLAPLHAHATPPRGNGTLTITAGGAAVTTIASGTTVTLTARALDNLGNPITPGRVSFCDASAPSCTDIHLFGTAQLNATGTATLKFIPAPGVHTYKAVFLTTTIYGANDTAPATLTVTSTNPTKSTLLAIGATGNTTLRATVTGQTAVPPSGTVSFLDTSNSNYLLGTATLVPGTLGTFSNSSQPDVRSKPSAMAGADFNGDGILDLAVANFGDNSLSILLGNGDGTFRPAITIPVGTGPSQLVVGDFNEDGIPDLAVINSGSTLTISLGNGDGTFRTSPIYYTGVGGSANVVPFSIAVGDFNRDGHADLAITNAGSGVVSILFGKGDGTFPDEKDQQTTATTPHGISVADVNGDGKDDLVIAVAGSNSFVVLLGNGDGTFTTASTTSTATNPNAFAIGDFNGDGIVDLAVVCTGSDTVETYLGKGDGTFTHTGSVPTGHYPLALAIADFNADGKPDLVATGQSDNSFTIYDGNGDGTFTKITGLFVGSLPQAVVALDFNGDGSPDIATANAGDNTVWLFLNSVSYATATGTGIYAVGTGTHYAEAVYAGSSSGAPSTSGVVGINATPVQTSLVLTANPTSSTRGQLVTLTATLTATTAQGHTAVGSVTFYSGKVSLGTVQIVNGAANLSTAAIPSGKNILTAVYSGETNFDSSTSNSLAFGVNTPYITTATTLTITAAGAVVTAVPVGTSITLTATVQAGSTLVRPGQVNFCDATAPHCTDIHLLGTAQLTAAGTASLSFAPGAGPHSYKAIFLGTNTDLTSASAAATLTVTGSYPSITTLAASGIPGNYTLSATVNGGGHIAPTGTVSFLDTTNSGYVLATAPLSSVTTGFNFFNASTPANGIGPESAVLGDFNNDGRVDMVIANEGTNALTVLFGNGDGTFTPRPDVLTGSQPIDVVAADFNNDGILDLAVTNRGSSALTILLGHGDGTFTAAASPATGRGPFDIALGDLNGDGNMDMAVANLDDGTVTILLGNGDGTFTLGGTIVIRSATPGATSAPSSVIAADFNDDGKLDLAVADSDASPGSLTILLGNGDGTFTQTASPSTGAEPFWLVTADFNADGEADLAVADVATGKVAILLGKGDGTFTRAADIVTAGKPNFAMAAADLNGDGKVDLAVTNSNANSILVVLGNGDGTFTPTTTPATGTNPDFIVSADFDGDGNNDLAVANFDDATTTILLSKSTATAQVNGISPVGTGIHIVDASYGGDTHFGTSLSNPVNLTALRVPTTLTLSATPGSSIYGHPVALTATLTPNTAQNHLISGTVNFYNSATLIGTAPVTGGAATFTTSTLPPGTDNLTAVYPGDTNFDTSTATGLAYVVAPYPPTLTFSVPDHTFGDPPFTVTATSNSTGAITYTVVSGPATISGSTVTLTGAGVVTLLATQAPTAVYSTGTATASFNVAKAAQSITFAQPASPVAYGVAPFALTATATSGLPVSFTILSGPATLSGSTVTVTGAGTIVIAANQPGNANYAAAPQVTRSVVVTAITPIIALTGSPNPAFLLNPVVLTATLSSPAGIPTGTVTFLEGSTVLGSAPVTGGVATLSISTLTLGSHSITAAYSGGGGFSPLVSAVLVELIEDFTLVINNPKLVIPHGGTAVYSLTVTAVGGPGMASTIGFTSIGAPDRSGITFSPSTVATGAGTTNLTLTIATPDYPVGPWDGGASIAALGLLATGGLLLPFGRKRSQLRTRVRRLGSIALFLAATLAVTTLSGCGWGWGPQYFKVKVTATSGQLSRSAIASLTSQ